MDDALSSYANALLPEPVRIFGRRLRPFSVGHSLILHQLESPFVTYARAPGLGDLLLALEICSRDYKSASRFMVRRWSSLWLRIRALCFFFRREHTITEGIVALVKYVGDSSKGPRFWITQRGGRPKGAPWLAVLVQNLMRTGYSFQEAINMRVSAALWHFLSYWESEGVVQIANDTDETLMEAAEKMRAACN